MPPKPEIQPVQTPTDDARTLIEELEAELSGDYTAHQRHGFCVERIFQPNILFFIARIGDKAVDCGALAFEDGIAEVKRMYVRPQMRGQQIGRAILARLEEEARTRGSDRLVLETGDASHRAIRLYEQAGFTRCAAFGPYLKMVPTSIERSVFMDKRLS